MADTAQSRFTWYDLMTPDPEAAKGFYGKQFGWSITPFAGGEMPCDMWTNAGTPMGGVMALPEEAGAAGAPPHWMGYVLVADVDSITGRARDLGAQVLVPPQEIPGGGRFAVLSDPAGAVFGVYQAGPEAPAPAAGPPPVGTVSWHELATDDWQAAFDFYQKLFGWKKIDDMDMGEAGIYRLFGVDEGVPIGGMFNRPPGMPVCSWLYYFRVDDASAAVARAAELGGQVVNGPIEVPGGDVVAQCVDPQGAMFAVHSVAAS